MPVSRSLFAISWQSEKEIKYFALVIDWLYKNGFDTDVCFLKHVYILTQIHADFEKLCLGILYYSSHKTF